MHTKWYFGFTDGDNKFKPFLKKGFSHVVGFCEINGIITVVEPSKTVVQIKHYFMEDKNDIINPDSVADLWIKKFGFTTVVEIDIDVKEENNIINVWNLFPSCVNCMKMVSSYRSKAQTPYQLYKSLMRNGGIEHGFNVFKA